MAKEDKFIRLKEEFIRINEEMIRFRGSDPIIGKIFAIIILSPTPLTQEDIANETGYSRSQISRLLKGLEEHQLITTRTQPGSRTQLYEGRARSFLDNFRRLFEVAGKFLSEKSVRLDLILGEIKQLPETTKKTAELKKFNEVVSVYDSMIHAYLDMLDEFVNKFEKRIKDLEKEMMQKRF